MTNKKTETKTKGDKTNGLAARRKHFRTIVLQEEKFLSPFAAKDGDAIRADPLSFECLRPNYWRDADRILHSFAFNRFLDKTQVFYLNENSRITHRMLHVQLVAKISRLLARSLRLNAHLVEAIALGHDIGHTPFGHEGERMLNKITYEAAQKEDPEKRRFFKHSVQSVRWLNILEQNSQPEGKPNNANGLNLSLQVLDGILCHDGEDLKRTINPDRKKDRLKFNEQYRGKRDGRLGFIKPMTLEGCLVRFSDVIAYIGRDIEDAIAVGLIDKFPDTPLGKSNGQIIDHLVMDLLENSEGKDYISYSKKTFEALKELYTFNMENIYKNKLITIHQERIARLFQLLFAELLDHLVNGKKESPIFKDHVFTVETYFPEYVEKSGFDTVVIDFLAGMTDSYFINLAKELFLPSPFPANFSDLTRLTGIPEKYLDHLIKTRGDVSSM